MLVKNLRTGVIGEMDDKMARILIEAGRVEEVKVKIEKVEAKPAKKNEYKTKDMKAES